MARGRMINRTLAKSAKFNSLSNDFTRLLYCLILPFTDRDGRIDGDPCSIRSDCFPKRRDISIDKVQKSLDDLYANGLINLYVVSGEQFIEVSKFKDNQTGLKYEREKESNIPSPDLVRIKSGSTPENVVHKRREEKLREEKLREAKEAREAFKMFYSVYPKKEDEESAKKAFIKHFKEIPPIDELIDIVNKNTLTEKWKKESGRFIPLPSNWLNKKRWKDDISSSQTSNYKYGGSINFEL